MYKNRYPIYVISKGRYNNCLTVRELKLLNAEFYLVVEPKEFEQYSKIHDNILMSPSNFSELGLGSIPVRNFCWEHSISINAKRHWILDDNIEGFHRLNQNTKYKVSTATIFTCAEDFVERYENIALAGFNYFSFCKSDDYIPPYYLNTRIYSCILIDNNLPFRWRGRYNEDTDLSLRCLKAGYCTVLFNAFLIGKVTTMRMSGGNTDTIYNTGDKRFEFAKQLAEQHPDCVKVTIKFNRYHHHVDYSQFAQNRLQFKKDYVKKKGINNYDMVLIENQQ